MRVLIFSTFFSETFLFLRRIHPDTVINLHMSSRKEPVMLLSFPLNLQFSDRISNTPQMSHVTKTRPVPAQLLHVQRHMGGRTDRQK